MALYFGVQPHTFEIQTLIRTAATGGIPPATLAFAGFAMIAGAAGKSAQVPLHVWLPDAMEAPTPISALIHAATMVNAGVYLMARLYPLFAGVPHWSQTLLWIGVVTAFLAGLAALVERDLKRLLAYSTVSQLGFMMFAVGNGGLLAAQFHLVSHAVFKALLFLCAGSVIHAAGTRDMGRMGGFGRTMKVTAAGFAVGACALAGVPFFNGFFSKDMIFAAAYESGNYVPLALAVLTAAMTVAYACKAFVLVFLGPSRAAGTRAHAGEAPLGHGPADHGLGPGGAYFLAGHRRLHRRPGQDGRPGRSLRHRRTAARDIRADPGSGRFALRPDPGRTGFLQAGGSGPRGPSASCPGPPLHPGRVRF